MLLALNIFQALGFYGFSNWVPALLTSQGVSFVKSLQYSFVIAIVYPLTPFLCSFIATASSANADRHGSRRHRGLRPAVFPTGHGSDTGPVRALVTISNIVMSYSYHAYQTELYPTRIRARAVGLSIPSAAGHHCVGLRHRDRAARFRHDRRIRFHCLMHARGRSLGGHIRPANAGTDTRGGIALKTRTNERQLVEQL